jgi:hypothetical protein
MGIFNKLFGRQQERQIPGQTPEEKKIPPFEKFPQLNVAERISIIMFLGDSGNPVYFPFLKYAILSDKDPNVKFAALKRIHFFKDHPDTISMFTELKNNGNLKNFEPYFSMALSRLGIISMDEFTKKINNT